MKYQQFLLFPHLMLGASVGQKSAIKGKKQINIIEQIKTHLSKVRIKK